jgi:Xaa-Pro aminopeptidase
MAVVGKPDRNQVEAYEIVVGAERATAEVLTPGSKVIEVHNAVKKFYETKGHKYKRSFIGHGLGIGLHEYPFLGPSHAKWKLEPGMYFQVEPGLTVGGTRVHTEDSFIVNPKGPAVNVSMYKDVDQLQMIK